MKIIEKIEKPFRPVVRYDPELDKYKDVILFSEKLAKVNKMLEKKIGTCLSK